MYWSSVEPPKLATEKTKASKAQSVIQQRGPERVV